MKKTIAVKIEAEFGDPKNLNLIFATVEAEIKDLCKTIVGSAKLTKQGILLEGQEVSVLDSDLIDLRLVEIEDFDTKTVW